jgi:hypothetical protein
MCSVTILSVRFNLYFIVEKSDAVEGPGSGYGLLQCGLLCRNLLGRAEKNHKDPKQK